MKRTILLMCLCVLGTAAQAIVIDDFEDADLSEYTLTLVLDQNAGQNVDFQSPDGTLQVTKSAGTEAEQVLFLRDDYTLGVGQTLIADLAWGSTSRADIGIAVAATATPTPLVYNSATGGTQENREDYIAVYAQADATNLKGVVVNGRTVGSTLYAGLPADPKATVTGLYIRRDSLTEFALGFIDGDGYHDFATGTVTNTNIGNAVGFFGDVRSVTTYGDLDNLRLWSDAWAAHDPSPATGNLSAGTALGDGTVDVALTWQAGLDPYDEAQVNPDITKHYVFLSDTPEDPNLYYLDTVAQPQPDSDPVTTAGTVSGLTEVTAYRWAVVEALNGYDLAVFTSASTLDDVDPNNLIGPTWTFTTAVGVNRRLVGEYLFENDLADSAEGHDGSLSEPNVPSFDTADPINATSGAYAVFNGIDNFVDLGTGAYPKAGAFPYGVGAGLEEGTITCWVKPTQVGGLLSNYNDGTTTGFALSLADNNGNVDSRINVRGESGDVGTVQGRPTMTGWDMLNDGRWHMVAATWKWGEDVRVYVDGGQVTAADATSPTEFADWQYGVLMGATRNGTDRTVLQNFYGGALDTLRIYNYVRTPEEIAGEYYQMTGEPACTNPAFDGSEFNFDNTYASYCKIDLADFAMLAAQWLSNGLSTGE